MTSPPPDDPALASDRPATTPEDALGHDSSGPDPVAVPVVARRPVADRLLAPMPRGGLIGWLGPLAVGVVAAVLRLTGLGRPNELIFDETYYAKDAFALLRFGNERGFVDDANELIIAGDLDVFTDDPAFVVHPTVGKWLIALGIRLFGMDPFGWRVVPAVAGVLLVVLVARIGRRLFRSNLAGTAAGALIALDGLSVVMSRTAILDGFLALFVVAAFGALLVDRDRMLARYVEWVDARPADDPPGLGPSLRWRPWRLLAGVLLGLACATKWNGAYALAVFGLLTVFWEVGARHVVGVGGRARSFWASLRRDAPWAFVTMVGSAALVYLASWWGWWRSDDAWSRQWATGEPATGLAGLVPDSVRSLWHHHAQILSFHTGLTNDHDYESDAWGWLFLERPVSFAYEGTDAGQGGCAVDRCSQSVLALGTPTLWWGGALALVACLAWWLLRADWRAGALLAGMLATWVPWLPFLERTIFSFYAVVIAPFLALAVVHALHRWIGRRRDGPVRRVRRVSGWVAAGVFAAATLWMAWYFWPIWSYEQIPYDEWRERMWRDRWI